MLSNELFALSRRAYYDSIGLTVDERNGEFCHCPLPERYGNSGHYLLHGDHQHQGLLQSRDIGECCFFPADVKRWLETCKEFPEGYFDLWSVYEEFASKLSSEAGKKAHKEKDEIGRSILALGNIKKIHAEKDEFGRSVQGVKNAERLHAEKDELGRSVQGVKNAKRLHERKDELGRSLNAMKAVERLNAEKDELGKSVNGVRNAEKTNSVKNERGKSIVGLRAAEKTHSVKDEWGRSVVGVKSSTQIWKSTVDGFESNAGNVAKHNRANGWDPKARVRIGVKPVK